jgi:hypothetical protein
MVYINKITKTAKTFYNNRTSLKLSKCFSSEMSELSNCLFPCVANFSQIVNFIKLIQNTGINIISNWIIPIDTYQYNI